MKKIKIELGRERPDYGEMAVPETASPGNKSYPCLYLSDLGSDAASLPKEGTATIKFRRVAKNEREDDEGEDKIGAELEIQSIEFEPTSGKPKGETPEDAFDKGMAKVESKENE